MVSAVAGWKGAYDDLNEAIEGLGSFLTKKDKDILNGLTPEEFLKISDDAAVVKWFGQFPEVDDAIERLMNLLLYLLPRYAHELKAEVTIAVGCTGGRHRSVFVAQRIGAAIREAGYEVVVHHRDMDRWRYS